jgi:hypothetical protein
VLLAFLFRLPGILYVRDDVQHSDAPHVAKRDDAHRDKPRQNAIHCHQQETTAPKTMAKLTFWLVVIFDRLLPGTTLAVASSIPTAVMGSCAPSRWPAGAVQLQGSLDSPGHSYQLAVKKNVSISANFHLSRS